MEKRKSNAGNIEVFLKPIFRDKLSRAFKNANEGSLSSFLEIVKSSDLLVFGKEDEIIQQELLKKNLFKVYREYIKEEVTKEIISKQNEKDTKVSSRDSVKEYIDKEDWRINANANTGYSNAGMISNLAGKLVANYWLDNVYSKEEGDAHRIADYHIHDLDCLTGYCAGWSLRALLDEGFNGVRGRVSAKAPKHFRSALGQMANFLGILQSEWAGAQAFSSFDTYLAPYIFIDNLSMDDIKKAISSFVYNLNVPARWGQSPFTNITLDFTVPNDLKDQIPTRDGLHLFKDLDRDDDLLSQDNILDRARREKGVNSLEELTYKHFQKEIEMIDIAYYQVMTEGDNEGQPFTFPIPTVNITEDFNWDSQAAVSLFENTAKIGNSYFQNFIGSQYIRDKDGNLMENPNAYKPGAVRSMCCRLQLDLRELLRRGNGLFGSAEMTGSIGVVTINMARLGYRFKNYNESIVKIGDKQGLFKELSRLMDLAKSTLEKKRVFVQELYERGFYPYTKRYLKHFRNHFSTIGLNGMNEMIRNFTGDSYDISDPRGMALADEILEFMRNKLKEYQNETGNLYNLEATPAEGTTYRFAKEDKKRYANIVQAGNEPNVYYTNSSQLRANFTDDPFEALTLQDELQGKYTGGTVLHLYMSEKISSTESCKRLVKTVLTNYRLPYITITPVFSTCRTHGYLNGEQETCPHCGDKTQVWTRVMGYHRPVDSFNIGKQGEHQERIQFIENEEKIKKCASKFYCSEEVI
ncbi:MAG: ribonucleoside triphosphate reductase [Rickettsiales bacterium]|jgi:ribonucleoside-triphosphate reductase|nr:ribonucleoside triphosphate reductase [Rickettsiales bacterium]